MNKLIPIVVVASVALLAGCASTTTTSAADTRVGTTTETRPTAFDNPPPVTSLDAFNVFELKPMDTGAGCAKHHGAEVALATIQQRLDTELGGLVSGLNAAAVKNAPKRALVIEPACKEVRLVGTQGRIWAGAFAGNSVIAMTVRYTDAKTGKAVAEPSFYQHASAMGAAWSFGASDRSMPDRVVKLITDYTTANYHQAVGGPSGR